MRLKLGNIHSIESRGLVFNSYQDQSTDFDNGVFGVKATYGKDWFDMSFIHGSDEYEFRSNPVNQLNDFSYDHTTTFLSTSIYPTDNIYLNLQLQNQSIDISDNVILDYYGRNFTTILGRDLILNQQGFQNDQIESYNVTSDVLGLSLETYSKVALSFKSSIGKILLKTLSNPFVNSVSELNCVSSLYEFF